MVMIKENVSYPMISASAWWAIRKKFIQSMPPRINESYLALLLHMEEKSAKNLLPPLKRIGLIDNDGRPTERANRWRDNEQYAGVCEEMRKEIYPHELLDLLPGSDASRTSIENWFASRAGVGAGAKRMMAAFYVLLSEADYTKQDSTTSSKTSKAAKSAPSQSRANASRAKAERRDKTVDLAEASESTVEAPKAVERNINNVGPSLHIDIQIHIASDASADQVDQIFASMAKHLYRSKGSNEQ